MEKPNILLVVWDACRYDYALEHASFLTDLASSNLWFENAIAPSPWSLPSHASIFTGELPHEHGRGRFTDSIDTPLVRDLSERGYRTYGVSANGFASQRTGFHEDFDQFRYTGGRDPYVDGLDVSGYSQNLLRDTEVSQKDALSSVLKRIPRHENSLKSFANLVSVGLGEVAMKYDALQRIPHPAFAPTSDYSYRPENNTRVIRSMIDSHPTEEPFFLFTNYMDTHRCYKPDERLQEKHVGRSLKYDELIRLNEEVAAPWAFESKKERGDLQEEDVEDIQGLYAGEVETADEHLKRLCNALEESGVLENTLIIVTSDHGENLGEADERGHRRLGHEASVSNSVLHVPLVVAHPDLEGRSISEPVSLADLFGLFVEGTEELLTTNGEEIPSLLPFEGTIASQYPATGDDVLFERHPDVDPETIRQRVTYNYAIAYDETWKVIAESTGERWAGDGEGEADVAKVPEALMEVVEDHLARLEASNDGKELSDEDVSQLEALGYM